MQTKNTSPLWNYTSLSPGLMDNGSREIDYYYICRIALKFSRSLTLYTCSMTIYMKEILEITLILPVMFCHYCGVNSLLKGNGHESFLIAAQSNRKVAWKSFLLNLGTRSLGTLMGAQSNECSMKWYSRESVISYGYIDKTTIFSTDLQGRMLHIRCFAI